MKKSAAIIVIALAAIMFTSDLFASVARKRYFHRPQIGTWFGPITPLFDTSDHVDPNLGGGAFFRYNLPYDPLKLGFETSYQKYESRGVNELRLVPVYMNLAYLLPLDFPVRTQLKAGAGACHIKMEPDSISQWDPMFTTGVEVSFPAGKVMNIALRLDYIYIFQRHLDGAKHDGHFFNAGISLYFNMNL